MTPADLARTHAAANTTDRAWTEDEFAALLSGPGTILTGDARAFALGRLIAGELEILTVATHPEHRRKGLARDALTALIARAAPDRTFLEVAEDNAAARALYAGSGFGQVGRRARYYLRAEGQAVDALVLACP